MASQVSTAPGMPDGAAGRPAVPPAPTAPPAAHEPLKGGQLFDMLELGIVAAARGYGVSIGDLLLVAEDVNAGRLGLPRPTAVYSGCSYYLVWPKTHRAQARLRRLRDFLLAEVAQMRLPAVERVMPGA